MVARVSLGCRRHTVHKAQFAAVTVFHADAQKVLLAHGGNVNQALLRVRELLHALDRVVQRVAEQGADVHRIHEIQCLPIGDAGQADALALALDGFCSQNRVQHAVAGLVLRLVGANLLLHLVEVLRALGGGGSAQQLNMVLQVMILLVDQGNGFFRNAVAFVLHVQQRLQMLHFTFCADFQNDDVIGEQHRDAAKVNGGADDENFRRELAGKGRSGEGEADIADGKDSNRKDGSGEQFPRRNLDEL